MPEFPVQLLQQLPDYLRAFRRQAGLTQAQAAARLGVTQQVFSSLERHPEKVSVERKRPTKDHLASESPLS